MPDQEDRKITLDIFDIAYMLTDVLRARGLLTPHEFISMYDLEPVMEACGFYLTIERKDGKIKIRRAEQEKALGIEHAETMPEHFGQDMSAMAEDTK